MPSISYAITLLTSIPENISHYEDNETEKNGRNPNMSNQQLETKDIAERQTNVDENVDIETFKDISLFNKTSSKGEPDKELRFDPNCETLPDRDINNVSKGKTYNTVAREDNSSNIDETLGNKTLDLLGERHCTSLVEVRGPFVVGAGR